MEQMQALDRIFNARSIAIVGASEDPRKLGSQTLTSILRGGYDGKLFPVNSKVDQLQGLRTYPSLNAIPDKLDLVVIIVPAASVPGLLREAVSKGAAGAVILSAGFKESGRADLETEIQRISRDNGLRLLGPNIQGLTYLPNKLNAVFWPVITTSGPLGIISQSGTITAALAEWAEQEGLGISAAVNLGNQTDLCESDILEFLAGDDHTRAIVVYLEGLKDGQRFLQTIKQVVRIKPLAVLKAGQTAGGQRAASSHTGSLAGSWEVFRGACDQYGATCVTSLEELYDVGKALATLRPPRGNRVLILSTSGGAGLLAAEEAERKGLILPRTLAGFLEAVKEIGLPPNAGLSNPMDLASLTPETFHRVAMLANAFDLADNLLLTIGDPVPGIAEVVQDLAARINASLAVSYLAGGSVEKDERTRIHAHGIPVFPSPERAIRGIAAVVSVAHWQRRSL